MAMQGSAPGALTIGTPNGRGQIPLPLGDFARVNEGFWINGQHYAYGQVLLIEGLGTQPDNVRFATNIAGVLSRGEAPVRVLRTLERWHYVDANDASEITQLKRLIARDRHREAGDGIEFSRTIREDDELELAFPFHGDAINGTTIGNRPIPAGTKVTVRGVATRKARVRTHGTVTHASVTIWVFLEDLQPVGFMDGKEPAELKAYDPKLPPEDLEDAILPNDPRIAWLFERIGEYAQRAGYCGQFDQITELFGIPGRKREFRVTFKLGPAEFSGKISARSQAEADEQFKRETLAAFKEAMAE